MFRTHTCGELRPVHIGQEVRLSGWVQRVRNLGGMTFIDLRDRYGITQLVFDMQADAALCERGRKLGREYVIQVNGQVMARSNINTQMPTGEIEIGVQEFVILNASEVPPFTIEDESDGGDEIRMRYRYLDLRRNPLRRNLELRHRLAQITRQFLDQLQFIEVETPVLIRSTPEGARDFVVPSRMNSGEFYALPQSPQIFKQLLMVAGYDRYFQIVKCFRDEDLRADRQPEFSQIDCEMAFVDQEDVLDTFEGLTRKLFDQALNVTFAESFPRMAFAEAMNLYGSDKPDIRFDMKIGEMTNLVKGKGFKVFDEAEYVGGICVPGGAVFSRKEMDALTLFVQRPQIGAQGMIYARFPSDGLAKSSVDKFFSEEDLLGWKGLFSAQDNDCLLLLAGGRQKTQKALGELRLHVAEGLGLRKPGVYAPLWVVDFPLLEWDEASQRFFAMHHPFTSPKPEDISLMDVDPGKVRANAYDLVINGVEIGGGSIRIFDRDLQKRIFSLLGFSPEQAQEQFGFLMEAFRYGAPPHGGIAFGFDRLVSLFAGENSIRDVIAFPKNNSGRDVMIDAPAPISPEQLLELQIKLNTAG
jgi:aspartyl-tRNA synthetase